MDKMAAFFRCTNEEPPGELEDDSLCHEDCPGSADQEFCGGGNRYWNVFSSKGFDFTHHILINSYRRDRQVRG